MKMRFLGISVLAFLGFFSQAIAAEKFDALSPATAAAGAMASPAKIEAHSAAETTKGTKEAEDTAGGSYTDLSLSQLDYLLANVHNQFHPGHVFDLNRVVPRKKKTEK